MARHGHPIHHVLVECVDSRTPASILDLGCGTGPTLAVAAKKFRDAQLIGFDASATNIEEARRALRPRTADLRVVNLELALPLEDASVDVVLCHNVLECVASPAALLYEAAEVMSSGAVAVWSHTDFDATIINTADVELGRRVVHAFADLTQTWMGHSDSQMGRKLAGLVRHSPLALERVDVHLTTSTELSGDALARIGEMTRALQDGSGGVDPSDVRRWRADVERTAADGNFFFAETAVIAVSSKAGPAAADSRDGAYGGYKFKAQQRVKETQRETRRLTRAAGQRG